MRTLRCDLKSPTYSANFFKCLRSGTCLKFLPAFSLFMFNKYPAPRFPGRRSGFLNLCDSSGSGKFRLVVDLHPPTLCVTKKKWWRLTKVNSWRLRESESLGDFLQIELTHVEDGLQLMGIVSPDERLEGLLSRLVQEVVGWQQVFELSNEKKKYFEHLP